MDTVVSKDGTTIAFDRIGEGAPVVLVCGGSVDRTSNAQLAQLLASDLTVFNHDRRGRGDSGDTPPYAIDREVEDIGAMIDAAGGTTPTQHAPSDDRRSREHGRFTGRHDDRVRSDR